MVGENGSLEAEAPGVTGTSGFSSEAILNGGGWKVGVVVGSVGVGMGRVVGAAGGAVTAAVSVVCCNALYQFAAVTVL